MHARVMKRAAWHLSFIAIISTRRPARLFTGNGQAADMKTNTTRSKSAKEKMETTKKQACRYRAQE